MAIEQQTSKYLPIWIALKTDGEVSITSPPHFHKKLIKAVKKRRDRDIGYLYDLAESHRTHTIRYKIHGTVIHFTLKTKLLIGGL